MTCGSIGHGRLAEAAKGIADQLIRNHRIALATGDVHDRLRQQYLRERRHHNRPAELLAHPPDLLGHRPLQMRQAALAPDAVASCRPCRRAIDVAGSSHRSPAGYPTGRPSASARRREVTPDFGQRLGRRCGPNAPAPAGWTLPVRTADWRCHPPPRPRRIAGRSPRSRGHPCRVSSASPIVQCECSSSGFVADLGLDGRNQRTGALGDSRPPGSLI